MRIIIGVIAFVFAMWVGDHLFGINPTFWEAMLVIDSSLFAALVEGFVLGSPRR